MAEAGVLATLGWVASPIIKRQIDKALDYLGADIEERRNKLAATVLPSLSLAIEKAERSPNKENVEIWLKKLKNAYYEAEDVIDLFEYELLKQKVRDDRKTQQQKSKNERGTRNSLLSQVVPRRLKFGSKNLKHFFSKKKLKHGLSVFSQKTIMLEKCIDKLINIGEEADKFRHLLEAHETANSSNPDRDTLSRPPEFFGREKDKKTIAGLLVEKNSNSEPVSRMKQTPIPIIAIMGRSGIGKTALAQYIYKCMEQQKHFNQPLWVHVPRIFKADDVIKNIIKTIKAEKGTLHESNYDPSTPLEALSRETEIKMLRSKKFLLVLDDFWCDSQDFEEQWEKFIRCLEGCLTESRILLTTQSASVESKAHINGLTKVTSYTLQDLEENHFLELFMHHAWPSGCCMQREKFEGVGLKIAAKLKGDPGAAKLLGRQLSAKTDLKHWEEVAQKDWLGDSMKARIWSYEQLPVDLQRCFTFCSLFPKGKEFPTQNLTSFWLAEGFIKQTHEGVIFKDICEYYVGELVSRFFLEKRTNNEGEVYMHDLFHDLAERVRGDEFITTTCDNFNKNLLGCKMDSIRHICLPASMTNELRDEICLMKNLCTLIVIPDIIISKEVLRQLFKHLKKLRVLGLLGSVDDLPYSIGDLKHLRYLSISSSLTPKKLPDSVCKLYHLQTLILESCESLPKNFCELISLWMFITESDMESPIFNVGRLTSLQILKKIVIKKESGYELHQLKNLNQLQQFLHIIGLENVANIEDAIQASMGEKKHLMGLNFEWRSDERAIDDFQLLDALQPHPNISHLEIKGYRGSRFPTWFLQQNSLIPNCKTLVLWELIKLEELPPFPSNLTSLELRRMPQLSFYSEDDYSGKEERKETIEAAPEISTMDVFFAYIFLKTMIHEDSLHHLDLDQMLSEARRKLKSGDLSPDKYLDARVMGIRAHVEGMFMNKKEKSLVLPSSLDNLWLDSCNIPDDALSSSIQSLVSLSKLKISKIQTITSLPPKEVFCALKSLQSLTIEKCTFLCSLGGIGALTSLTELKLERCESLDASNEPLPSSLRKLELILCTNVHVILGNSHLPILRDLTLIALDTETVAFHVGHLSSLENLSTVLGNNHMEGLSLLCRLHTLYVGASLEKSCTASVDKYKSQLKTVAVSNSSLLKLMLSDETISSIENLAIYSILGDRESLNYEVFNSLSSLRHLELYQCEITHLLPYMKNLASLRYMYLQDCQEDFNLDKLEDLTQNLRKLKIKNCPTLMEKFKKGGISNQRRKEIIEVVK